MASYLEKAKESLKAARILFEAECYNSCTSRCYYAMFQMAIAALVRLGIHPPQAGRYGHAWVHAAIARELVHRRKILPAALAKALPDALKLREEADYSDTTLGRKRAERLLKHCQEFVSHLQREVLRDVES
jgi:uncharacterized protein (UPF0332 family)